MPVELTDTQRRQLLQFVAENSPQGQPFSVDAIPGVSMKMFGVDLGWGLLTLDCEGLCGTEDPDIVWSTPEGLAALQDLNGKASV